MALEAFRILIDTDGIASDHKAKSLREALCYLDPNVKVFEDTLNPLTPDEEEAAAYAGAVAEAEDDDETGVTSCEDASDEIEDLEGDFDAELEEFEENEDDGP